ncbi:MAG: M20/M25/M40 family metallo-hydrolase [Candidatus Micrarchaeota archaeon]|nr:M20/M25/M40 family metallo-hydrolase [Candidatus Micrarchaeota archaeon]MDE1864639.1 M20/M25/M40 family metallo-hydrolase [Candidatus Micrarchaeota archaeon]
MNSATIVHELVKRPSITKDGEGRVGSYVAKLMEKNGFKVTLQEVVNSQNGTSGVITSTVGARSFNVLATKGESLNVLLQAHMDTVGPWLPVSNDWIKIRGRGSADTKGPLGAMIAAAISASKKGYTNFGLLGTVREETDFAGAIQAARLFRELNQIPKLIIDGEPTNFELMGINGMQGRAEVKVSFNGTNTHVATPGEKDNAVLKMSKAILDLEELRKNLPLHQVLGQTIINSTRVDATENGTNSIPHNAAFWVDARTSVPAGQIVNMIEAAVAPNGGKVTVTDLWDPIPPLSEGVKGLGVVALNDLKVIPEVPSYVGESHVWSREGIPSVIVGPGLTSLAHQPDESITISDIKRGEELYLNVIKEACRP